LVAFLSPATHKAQTLPLSSSLFSLEIPKTQTLKSQISKSSSLPGAAIFSPIIYGGMRFEFLTPKPIIGVIDESSKEDVEIIRLGVEETRSETVSGVSLFMYEPEIGAERVDETMLEPTPILEEDIWDIAEEGFAELEKED